MNTAVTFRQLISAANIHKPTVIGIILDMRMLTPMLIISLWFFKVFKIFLVPLFVRALANLGCQ